MLTSQKASVRNVTKLQFHKVNSEFLIISNVLRNLFKIDMHWSSLTILMMHSVKRQEFEEEYWRLLKVLKLCEYSELSPRKLWHLLWRSSPGGATVATVAINCQQTMLPFFLHENAHFWCRTQWCMSQNISSCWKRGKLWCTCPLHI